jgi:hypothetical protein
LAGSGSSRDSARWRVFLSHTSELQEFPRFKSYLDVVKEAISAAGHVIVEMAGFLPLTGLLRRCVPSWCAGVKCMWGYWAPGMAPQ